jgi:hypothetical protein
MAGGMRRPPRLWEQKLERMVRNLSGGAGVTASAGAADQGTAPGPGGPGESVEPTPVVDDDPTTPRIPATPSVFAAIGGLSIIWTGLDDDGAPYPTGTTVQVHLSTTSGFTPSSGTLEGVIRSGERIVVTGLTSGTTYYVKFVLVAPDGTIGETSAQQSASAGFVLNTDIGQGEITADLVSFDASAIGGIQQFVGTTQPTVTNAGQPTQSPANGSTWINTSNGSYYTLTSGSWVQRQWQSAAIAANAISTTQLAAGAITAGSGIIGSLAVGNAQIADLSASKLTAGTIDASVISVINLTADNIETGTLSGDRISGGTITGSTIVTRPNGSRIRLVNNPIPAFPDFIEFLEGSTRVGQIDAEVGFGMGFASNNFGFYALNGTTLASLDNDGAFEAEQINTRTALIGFTSTGARAFRINVSGEVFSLGIDDATTGNAANVRIGNSAQLLKSTSTARLKDDLQPLVGDLAGVDDSKLSAESASCAWHDVLEICPTEFASLSPADNNQRILGFIAEDVAAKFPWAAEWDDEGLPAAVNDRPILASLLAVVKEQQQTIADLTARIEALEG